MNPSPPTPRILSVMPCARLDYVVGERRFPVVGLALVQYPDDDAPCVEPLYVDGEYESVMVGASHYSHGDVVPRGAPTAAEREAAQAEAAEARRTTEERNRALVLRTLRERPAGVPKRELLDMLRGRATRRRELLASLLMAGVIVEYRSGRATYVTLRPNEAPNP
jgi:hypothetical protein